MRRISLIFISFFLGCVVLFAQNEVKEIGNFKSLKQSDSVVTIMTENAVVKIASYGENIVQIHISTANSMDKGVSYAVQKSIKKMPFKRVRELPKSVVLATDSLTVSVSKFPLRINFYRKGGEFINGDHVQYGVSWINGKVYNYRLMGVTEHFIGLGAKTGNIDKAGQKITLWNSDVADIDVQNEDFASQSVPFYISIYNKHPYGLFLDNPSESVFDFGASNARRYMSIEAQNGDLNYYFFGASDVSQIIADYSAFTGSVKMPPIWAFGYQTGLPQIQNNQEIQDWFTNHKETSYPMDVFLLRQRDEDSSFPFSWNRNLISSPLQVIDSLKTLGLHVITTLSPGISEDANELYNEAISKKYAIMYPLGDVFETEDKTGNAIILPDFMKKATREWWGKQFKNYTTMGLEGFINVNNEPSVANQRIPDHIKLGNSLYVHLKNVYGLQMAKANAEGLKELLPTKRSFILSRAGYAGLQNYAGVYLDGFEPNDSQMLSSQRMLQSLGASAMPLAGVNMAGKNGISNPELLIRWHSIAVFSSLMLYFPEAGNTFNSLLKFEKHLKDLFVKDLNLRYRLLPYLYSSWYQNTIKGLPLVKTLAENYPWDEQIYRTAFQNQFMFGNQFLVCPVASDAHTSTVYLPKGNWFKISTDSLYNGEQSYEVKTPLNDLPVFVKSGSIIPMQNKVNHTLALGDAILQLHIWKGDGTAQTVYYEDDGVTNQYLENAFYKRKIEVDFTQNKLVLGKVEGNFESKYKKIEVILHGFISNEFPKSQPMTKINQTGLASFTTFKMIENSNEKLEIDL